MKAIWEDTVVAESDKTIIIEGNHYFPPDSIKTEHFLPSDTQSTCHWKGTANYYHVQVGDKSNRRRLVLSGTETSRQTNQRVCCILARHQSERVAARPCSS
jgi:hypothetical protein